MMPKRSLILVLFLSFLSVSLVIALPALSTVRPSSSSVTTSSVEYSPNIVNTSDIMAHIDRLVNRRMLEQEDRIFESISELSSSPDFNENITVLATLQHLRHSLAKIRHDVHRLKESSQQHSKSIRRLSSRNRVQNKALQRMLSFQQQWQSILKAVSEIVHNNQNLTDSATLLDLNYDYTEYGDDETESTMSGTTRTTITTTKSYGPINPRLSTVKPPVPPRYPRDCQELYDYFPGHFPGVLYTQIKPEGVAVPFRVACKITRTEGWTEFHRRMDGSIDFYRNWTQYQSGFGKLETEFWLGLDHIYHLTNQKGRPMMLHIEMKTWRNQSFYADYKMFRVSNSSDNYRLSIGGYEGTAGDSLGSIWNNHNNVQFSTYDRDNDDRFRENCASTFRGAWWFKNCFESHLNGIYYKPQTMHINEFMRSGIQWNTISLHESLKFVSMMVKPLPVQQNAVPNPALPRSP